MATHNQTDNQPAVEIFGEKIDRKHHRHHDSGIWGMVFLFAGIILILNNIGVVSWQFWSFVWIFWPVLLILIGIRIILGHNLLSRIVSLVLTLFVLGFVIIYGLQQINSPLINFLPVSLLNYFQTLSTLKIQTQ
jgi:hypothetical protein